jgi:hypothetical protein
MYAVLLLVMQYATQEVEGRGSISWNVAKFRIKLMFFIVTSVLNWQHFTPSIVFFFTFYYHKYREPNTNVMRKYCNRSKY